MKKVLLIHNFYKNYGGEDSVVEDETQFLKKYVELDTLFFQNTGSIIKDSFNVVSTNRTNLISLRKLKHKIQEFRPILFTFTTFGFLLNLVVRLSRESWHTCSFKNT